METVLITGANGEIGHGLIPALSKSKKFNIVALDIRNINESLRPLINEVVVADVLDRKAMGEVFQKFPISSVFHLAAILSTAAEKDPERAHSVNVNGTESLLSTIKNISNKEKRTVKFIFPSSIAVYGMPDINIKNSSKPVKEEEFNSPITMYGINKLYCELLGKYYSTNYQLLTPNQLKPTIDFRCLRFPGIISALTIPSGGTSDYAPEMIHSAAKGEGYETFVRPDTIIPFMVMPDAVKALIQLNEIARDKLTRSVYNVTSFSAMAGEIAELINKIFPDSAISYNPDPKRQIIVDSWPASIDDSAARNDWGWKADYDINKSFNEYLIPEIQNRYKT